MTSRNAKPLLVAADLEWCLRSVLHILLYAALCAAPALVLLPVWHLDREPSNEITQEQQDQPPQDPDAELAVAA